MKTQTVKLKILAVGPEQKHLTTTKTTRKVVMTVGEIADCQLDIRHYKGNSNVPAGPKFIVNDLSFRL